MACHVAARQVTCICMLVLRAHTYTYGKMTIYVNVYARACNRSTEHDQMCMCKYQSWTTAHTVRSTRPPRKSRTGGLHAPVAMRQHDQRVSLCVLQI